MRTGYRSFRTPRHRRGLTLVEMLIASTVIGIIMVSMGSVMLLSVRVLGSSGSGITQERGATTLAQLTEELREAESISSRPADGRSIIFTVPDRDGDGNGEVIQYTWSGTPGTPLYRRYNYGSTEEIVEAVDSFSLSYLTRELELAMTSEKLVESDEMLLAYHDDAPQGELKSRQLTTEKGAGQFFRPSTLPLNTVSWSVRRVLWMGRADGDLDGRISVQVTAANADGTPGTPVYETVLVDETTLPADFLWQQTSLSSVAGIDPGEGLCLVMLGTELLGCGRVEFEQDGVPMPDNMHWLSTSTMGTTWSKGVNKSMRVYIYGTVTTNGPPLWP
jgi:prepilin-type N-terminal cleavage/methylation domain-containing protein